MSIANTGAAQSIWDRARPAGVKQNLGQPAYQAAYRALADEAERALERLDRRSR